MTHRERFLAEVVKLIGGAVLWSMKGPFAHDCSGTVTASLKLIGGPDLTQTDNAQHLHDKTRALVPGRDLILPGDLVFYGLGPLRIEHVATIDESGTGVISADGATSAIDPRKIGFDKALALSLANPSNRVRRHARIDFRGDLPFYVVHRNDLVDALDQVEH